MLSLAFVSVSCGSTPALAQSIPAQTQSPEAAPVPAEENGNAEKALHLIINNTEVSVDWEDNASVRALTEAVSSGILTVQMSMYGGFEQVGSLGAELPRNDSETTTQAGDIVLYSGNQIVVFYGSNSWAYTRLGRITDKSAEELTALLGNGDVKLTLTAAPVVFFTANISPEGLQAVYDALDWQPSGKLAVKVSTGEPPASNYLRAELIGPLVQSLHGTITECNTAYGGSRSSSAMHRQVAEDHGFTSFAEFDLLDEEGEAQWPVAGGQRLQHAIVGSHADNYTDWLILSHFKGHAMAGFGGAIKNVGIGMSSASGKVYVHSAGTRTSGSIMYRDQDAWLEAMAEMVTAVRDHVGPEHIRYINVMNRLSVDCDCDGHPAEPDIHDIGILASADPVALDQACIDLVWQAEGNDALVRRVESKDGLHTLDYAEQIGLGSKSYTLIRLDN